MLLLSTAAIVVFVVVFAVVYCLSLFLTPIESNDVAVVVVADAILAVKFCRVTHLACMFDVVFAVG